MPNMMEMINRFASRIRFVQLRNVASTGRRDFYEENHLEGNADMHAIIKALLLELERRRLNGEKNCSIPMRPDHGHLMIPDMSREGIYPGYSLFGRMRGLAELTGIEYALKQELGL